MSAPDCPKCGQPMTGGAPHGPGSVQWECRRCNVFVTAAVPQRLVKAVGAFLRVATPVGDDIEAAGFFAARDELRQALRCAMEGGAA